MKQKNQNEILNKVDTKLLSKVVDLVKRVKKADKKCGSGYIQSAVLAELFAAMYNDPTAKIKSVDKLVLKYEK